MVELAPAWKRAIDTDMYELIRLDSEAAYFFFKSAKGRWWRRWRSRQRKR